MSYTSLSLSSSCESQISLNFYFSLCTVTLNNTNFRSVDNVSILYLSRPYTALVIMVLVTVTKAEDPQEYQLELCRNRGADWRHNQHNYIFSGFLKKVCCRIRTDGNYSIIKLHCKLQQKERRLDWKSARRYCRERCMDLVSIGRQPK